MLKEHSATKLVSHLFQKHPLLKGKMHMACIIQDKKTIKTFRRLYQSMNSN